MKPGLVTLADLPDLPSGKKPTSTIVVARLDDKLRDPRYGRFKITQSDVDGWQRNLADTFGGRVAIDADHSSDRGGGTRAMGWITNIGQDGSLITADVEWTPRGAKSIRNGDYRHISPTFVADYTDEHGEKYGKALIGAALTNRPVLRKGVPALSLSKDSFDGVATPRNGGGPTMTTLTKKLSKTTSKEELERALRTLSPEQVRELIEVTLSRTGAALAAVFPGRAGVAGPSGSVDTVTTLAQFAPPGIQYAGTTDWGAPQTAADREPPGLDDSGRALHTLIAQRAASTGAHYFDAMADVTGIAKYRELSDMPPTPMAGPALDPERQALDNAARALAASAGISWLDACSYLMDMPELAEAQNDTGAASVPWLDSRPLSTPPRPWSEEDWNRDKRRATAAGVVVGAINEHGEDTQLKGLWRAGAEQGRDVVGEMAAGQRADALATAQQRGHGVLDQARAREDDRRAGAINAELIRRARDRVAAPGRPAARRLPGTI